MVAGVRSATREHPVRSRMAGPVSGATPTPPPQSVSTSPGIRSTAAPAAIPVGLARAASWTRTATASAPTPTANKQFLGGITAPSTASFRTGAKGGAAKVCARTRASSSPVRRIAGPAGSPVRQGSPATTGSAPRLAKGQSLAPVATAAPRTATACLIALATTTILFAISTAVTASVARAAAATSPTIRRAAVLAAPSARPARSARTRPASQPRSAPLRPRPFPAIWEAAARGPAVPAPARTPPRIRPIAAPAARRAPRAWRASRRTSARRAGAPPPTTPPVCCRMGEPERLPTWIVPERQPPVGTLHPRAPSALRSTARGCPSGAAALPGPPRWAHACPSGCTDVTEDPENCGFCGNRCASGLCLYGSCLPPSGSGPPGDLWSARSSVQPRRRRRLLLRGRRPGFPNLLLHGPHERSEQLRRLLPAVPVRSSLRSGQLLRLSRRLPRANRRFLRARCGHGLRLLSAERLHRHRHRRAQLWRLRQCVRRGCELCAKRGRPHVPVPEWVARLRRGPV